MSTNPVSEIQVPKSKTITQIPSASDNMTVEPILQRSAGYKYVVDGHEYTYDGSLNISRIEYEDEITKYIQEENPDYNPDGFWNRLLRSGEIDDTRLAFKIKKCEELFGEKYDISGMTKAQKKQLEDELDVILYGAIFGARRRGLTLDEYIAQVDGKERMIDRYRGAIKYAEGNEDKLQDNAALKRIVDSNEYTYNLFQFVQEGKVTGCDTTGINSIKDLLRSPDLMSIELEYLQSLKENGELTEFQQKKYEKFEYMQNVLDFVKSGKVQGIDVSDISSIKDLMKSPKYFNIEYQYLLDKKENGELSEHDQGELEVLDALAKLYGGDLSNVKISQFGDGTYCEEFRNCSFLQRTINKISGNNLETKLRGDLAELSSEEQQAKISEILQTAKDKQEAWLLLTLLVKLEKEGVVKSEAFNNAAEDAGNSIHVISVVAQDASEDLQQIVTDNICEEIKNGEDGAFTSEQKEELPSIVAGYEHPAGKVGELAETGDQNIINGIPDAIGVIVDSGKPEDIAEIPVIIDSIPEPNRAEVVDGVGNILEQHPDILEKLGIPQHQHSGVMNNTVSQQSGGQTTGDASHYNVFIASGGDNRTSVLGVSDVISTNDTRRTEDNNRYRPRFRRFRPRRMPQNQPENKTTETTDTKTESIANMSSSQIVKLLDEATSAADRKDILTKIANNSSKFESVANSWGLEKTYYVTRGMSDIHQKTLDLIDRQKGVITSVGNFYDNIVKNDQQEFMV